MEVFMWTVGNIALRKRATLHSDVVMLTHKYLTHLNNAINLFLHVRVNKY